jgi:hypothetical protein
MEMNPHSWRVPETVDDGDDLRSLDWRALLARLAAERDLRREFAAGRSARHAASDFMNGAALVVGDSSHPAQSVNPGALANLKATGGITVAAGTNNPVAKLEARGKQ